MRNAIIIIISSIVSNRVLKLIISKKRNNVVNPNVIKQPDEFLNIAIVGLICVYVVLPIINLFDSDGEFHGVEGWIALFILATLLYTLFLPLLLFGLNWKVEVFDDHIKYRNVFRKTKIFSFDEYEIKNHGYELVVVKRIRKKGKYKNKRYLKIFSWAVNYDYLLPKYKKYKQEKLNKVTK